MGVFLPVVAGCRRTGDGEAEGVGVRWLAGNFSPEKLLRRRSSVDDATVVQMSERRNFRVKKTRKGKQKRTRGSEGIGAV